MDKDPGHAMVHGANSVERVHRDQPSERETGNTYEKSFEIRFDEIDFIGHLHNTRYLEYCSHTRYCHFVEQGWDLRRMGEQGIGAVSLTEERSCAPATTRSRTTSTASATSSTPPAEG
jgi:hypothetical protein